jgi:hypothetical protein
MLDLPHHRGAQREDPNMSPGAITSATRDGYSFSRTVATTFSRSNVYCQRSGTPFARNRALPGQRNRFAASTNPDTGAHAIALDDREAATVTLQPDGALTIEIANKPGPGEGEEAGAGNGNSATFAQTTLVAEPARRAFASQRNRMSWTRETGGQITFVPDDGEVLVVDGDAIQAVVSAHPSPQMPNG